MSQPAELCTPLQSEALVYLLSEMFSGLLLSLVQSQYGPTVTAPSILAR